MFLVLLANGKAVLIGAVEVAKDNMEEFAFTDLRAVIDVSLFEYSICPLCSVTFNRPLRVQVVRAADA